MPRKTLLKYCELRKAFRADGPVSQDGKQNRSGTGADAGGPDGQAERRALGIRRERGLRNAGLPPTGLAASSLP